MVLDCFRPNANIAVRQLLSKEINDLYSYGFNLFCFLNYCREVTLTLCQKLQIS